MITIGPSDSLSGVAGTAAAITYSIFGDTVSGSPAVDAFALIAQGQLATSAATLVAAAGGAQRLIKSILLTNTTGSAVSGIALYADGTTAAHQLVGMTIQAGGSATYTDGKGWTVYDSTGAPLGGSTGLASIANSTLLANISGATAPPIGNTLTALIDAAISNTQGSLLYRNATVWTAIGPGAAGQLLQSGGAAANPGWSNPVSLSTQNSFVNVQAVSPVYGTISGAVNINLAAVASSTGFSQTSGPAASNTLVLTLTGNVSSLAFTGGVDGAVYNFYLVENSTGGFTIAAPTGFNFGAVGSPSFTLTPHAINLISAQYLAGLSSFRAAVNAG